MDDDTSALATAIGSRVRQERHTRKLTLEQLAEVAGVSRRMVINVEQGTTNPSVGILLRISDALGIGLPSLVGPPDPASIKVSRRGEGAALWTGENGGRGVLVAGTQPPDVLELWDWTLGPGDSHATAAHTPGTRELIQVQDGTVSIEIAGQLIALEMGDAITFAGDVPHSYSNAGAVPARFSMAVFEPGVGMGSPRTRP